MLEDVQQVIEGLYPIGLSGFDQAVDRGTGLSPSGRVSEQPIAPSYCKGPDGILSQGIADVQLPVLAIT